MKSAIALLSALVLMFYLAAAMDQPWRSLPAAELQKMKYARDFEPNRKMSNEPDQEQSIQSNDDYRLVGSIQREIGELAASNYC